MSENTGNLRSCYLDRHYKNESDHTMGQPKRVLSTGNIHTDLQILICLVQKNLVYYF